MTPITKQQAFDNALFAMRERDYRPSTNDQGSCFYRSPRGPCAIGASIPDDLYRESMENRRFGALCESFSEVAEYFSELRTLRNGLSLGSRLQMAHDSLLDGRPEHWFDRFETDMRQIAKDFDLVFTENGP